MGSKALDLYMKQEASNYLKTTLETILKLVILNKQSCELDPVRINEMKEGGYDKDELQQIIQKHASMLIDFTDLVFKNILKTIEHIPISLKRVFGAIQNAVVLKFPESEVAKYTSVTGFLFLRFFVPAILTPRLFGIQIGNISSQESRTLTLIAKTLQNLGNLTEFGQKEQFMAPINQYIESRLGDIKLYLDKVAIFDQPETFSTCSVSIFNLVDGRAPSSTGMLSSTEAAE